MKVFFTFGKFFALLFLHTFALGIIDKHDFRQQPIMRLRQMINKTFNCVA